MLYTSVYTEREREIIGTIVYQCNNTQLALHIGHEGDCKLARQIGGDNRWQSTERIGNSS